MKIYYLLTQKCNLSCCHCIRSQTHTSATMATDAALCNLERLHQYYPDATLILSGGEPTLHPDFDTILGQASSLFSNQTVIATNGTTAAFRNENLLDTISSNKKIAVQFSLDGDEAYHDSVRGNGSFAKTLTAMLELNRRGKEVWIATIATKHNLSSIMKLEKVLEKFNVRQWKVDPEMPFGSAAFRERAPSIPEWNRFVNDLISMTPFNLGIKKLFNFEALDRLSIAEITEIACNPRSIMLRNCGCVNDKLYINADFSVYGCTCLEDFPLGNMITDSWEQIINSENACLLSQYQLQQECKCNSCRYLPICNSGCIGMSVHVFGKLGMGDSRCPLLQTARKELS